jgi:hypothetical protein
MGEKTVLVTSNIVYISLSKVEMDIEIDKYKSS